jgi:hypothetical protein
VWSDWTLSGFILALRGMTQQQQPLLFVSNLLQFSIDISTPTYTATLQTGFRHPVVFIHSQVL